MIYTEIFIFLSVVLSTHLKVIPVGVEIFKQLPLMANLYMQDGWDQIYNKMGKEQKGQEVVKQLNVSYFYNKKIE